MEKKHLSICDPCVLYLTLPHPQYTQQKDDKIFA